MRLLALADAGWSDRVDPHPCGRSRTTRCGNNPRPTLTRGAQLGQDDEKFPGCGKSETDFVRSFVDRETLRLKLTQGLEPLTPSIRDLGRSSVGGARGSIDANPALRQWRFTGFDRGPLGGRFASAQVRKHAGICFAAREKSKVLARVNRFHTESIGRLGDECGQQLALQRDLGRGTPIGER